MLNHNLRRTEALRLQKQYARDGMVTPKEVRATAESCVRLTVDGRPSKHTRERWAKLLHDVVMALDIRNKEPQVETEIRAMIRRIREGQEPVAVAVKP